TAVPDRALRSRLEEHQRAERARRRAVTAEQVQVDGQTYCGGAGEKPGSEQTHRRSIPFVSDIQVFAKRGVERTICWQQEIVHARPAAAIPEIRDVRVHLAAILLARVIGSHLHLLFGFQIDQNSGLAQDGPNFLGIEDVKEDDLVAVEDRKSTRLNSSHLGISYAVFCLKKKKI